MGWFKVVLLLFSGFLIVLTSCSKNHEGTEATLFLQNNSFKDSCVGISVISTAWDTTTNICSSKIASEWQILGGNGEMTLGEKIQLRFFNQDQKSFLDTTFVVLKDSIFLNYYCNPSYGKITNPQIFELMKIKNISVVPNLQAFSDSLYSSGEITYEPEWREFVTIRHK